MTLEIQVCTETQVTREPDHNDSLDRGDTTGAVTGVRVEFADVVADEIKYRSHLWESPAEPGDLVYVVIADYETGDTFGRYGGQYDILDVFTLDQREDAIALAKVAEKADDFTFSFGGKDYYANWTGYFETLNEVRAWGATVT